MRAFDNGLAVWEGLRNALIGVEVHPWIVE